MENEIEKSEHPENICQQCGGKNPVWSADNELWNQVNGSPNGILCPTCFVKKANELGISVLRITNPLTLSINQAPLKKYSYEKETHI